MPKSFKTYKPETGASFDVNGTEFHLRPSVPGDVLLDFLVEADSDKPAQLAKTIRDLMQAAIVEDELAAWHAFIRDEDNAVDLATLSEIAGYVAEQMSGNDRQPQPVPYGPG